MDSLRDIRSFRAASTVIRAQNSENVVEASDLSVAQSQPTWTRDHC